MSVSYPAPFDRCPAASTGRRVAAWLRLWVFALLPVLLAVGSPAQSWALFRCQYTGAVLSSCCCSDDDFGARERPASVSRAHCCRVERVEASLPSGVATPEKLDPPPLAWRPWPLPSLPAPSVVRVASWRPPRPFRFGGPTRAGPSLNIVHRRLLL